MINQNNRQNQKKSSPNLLSAVVVVLVALSALGGIDEPELLIGIVGLVAVVAGIVFTVKAVNKNGKAGASRPTSARRTPERGVEHAEQAVHCAHSTGKQKYLDQLDSFLASGIIDKAEYKLMKERYSKLEIEDDYH